MSEPVPTTSPKGSRVVIGILASAMFIYVVDTTIMNVSISALVEDLDTTVGGVQAAITLYTLTMAAFMLTGGKLGDIWGPKRAFRIGLIVYGVGTTLTALAPNLLVLIIGWSVLEGLGSALIVPAINTLVRANFDGPSRASAYGTLFGVAAAGAAFGPLIGGWLTTELSWRVAFAAEAAIVVTVLATSRLLIDAPAVTPRPRLDLGGVALSAAGLGMTVYGVLRTSSAGWDDPLVAIFVVAGLVVLAVFWRRAAARERGGLPTLMHPSIFRHRAISAGLPILSSQTFAQAGLLFLVPLFTQAVLGFTAFETGLTLLPLSFGVLATSTLTPPLGRRIRPRVIIQAGLVVLFVGGVLLALALEPDASGIDLAPGLLVGGIAIGLIAGQLPNLILSGVSQSEASEASGLQGTSQNLGMALGTAVIGTVILSVGLASVERRIDDSETLPDEVRAELTDALQRPLETADAEALARVEVPDSARAEVEQIYADGTVTGFRGAVLAGGLAALLGAGLAFRLPGHRLGERRAGPDDGELDDGDGDGDTETDRGTDDGTDDGGRSSTDRIGGTIETIVRNPTIAKFQLEMTDFDPTGT